MEGEEVDLDIAPDGIVATNVEDVNAAVVGDAADVLAIADAVDFANGEWKRRRKLRYLYRRCNSPQYS